MRTPEQIEKDRAANKRSYIKHRESRTAHSRFKHKENADAINKQHREYYAANKTHCAELKKDWRKRNPDKVKAIAHKANRSENAKARYKRKSTELRDCYVRALVKKTLKNKYGVDVRLEDVPDELVLARRALILIKRRYKAMGRPGQEEHFKE